MLTDEAPANGGALWQNLARALVCCGRGGSAADAYLQAAKHASEAEAVPLMRLAASHLLRSGRFDEGERLVNEVLSRRSLSLPQSDAGLMAAIAWERCRVRLGGLKRRIRDDGSAPRDLLDKFDLFYYLRSDSVAVDPLWVALLQARSLRLALEAGEPTRVVLALCAEANLVSMQGTQAFSRANELLEQAGELASRFDSPTARAVLHMSRGWMAWMLGRSADALEPCLEAERTFRLLPHDERAYFMRSTAANLRIGAFRELGQFSRFLDEVDRAVREARSTENHTALLQLASAETMAEAFRGNPEASRSRLEAQRPTLPRRRFGVLHTLHMISVAQAACATGQYEWALRLWNEDWPRYLQSPVSRAAFLSLLAHAMRVQLTLNAALASGKSANVEADVAPDLRVIAHLALPGSRPFQQRFQARLTCRGGAHAAAEQQLRRTLEQYESLGWLGEAECTRLALGVWIGGDAGEALCRASEDFLRREQIADPLAYVRSVYPEVFVSG
jgi:hypothetical protein